MAEVLDRVKAALADRYTIEREIGSGGMATVYLAHDLKHDRTVALKVLRPELALAVGSDRFLREITITAQLNHPHILPLLDSGEADGLLFYVMPYAAGGSLRRCIGRDRPLPLDEALRIAREVAAAIDHAHRHGVIHRDIKPENILFSEGLAVVADFGIAKAISAASPAQLTQTGVALGTPGYMSPEQAFGTVALDPRTDIYSLACVVYEMLIGETPIFWPTDEALRLRRLVDAPAEHRELLNLLPGRVEQALVRALALRPADRFRSPVEFAEALVSGSRPEVKLSDGQVQAIIGRAARLQAEQRTEERVLSIGAVEQIAAEVGIPPEHVRQALHELEWDTGPAVPGGSGVPAAVLRARSPARFDVRGKTVVLERRVAGEVSEPDYAALIEEIQATLGIVGESSIVEGALRWTPAQAGSGPVVTIGPGGGRTRIRIEERLELPGWKQLAPTWGAAAGALFGFVLAGVLQAPEQFIAVPALIFAFWGGYLTANAIGWSSATERRPQLEILSERLALAVERAALPAPDGPR